MKATIYRGTHEIGGTLIELQAGGTRLLLDAGYPLFLNGGPIDDSITKLPHKELLKLGVLPTIDGLYQWDAPGFDGILISHAHIDHYGLLKYVHPDIPVYLSAGTKKLIELSQTFKICEPYPINARQFTMRKAFTARNFTVTPYLMDHSAFDAAAFEIKADGKTVIYSGDFRGHGRKAICLDKFIDTAAKQPDVLFIEGSIFSRHNERILTEDELENTVVEQLRDETGIALFQSSGQNIDRLVSFYKAALRLKRIFVVDVYTANVLHELRILGHNELPYSSKKYGIRVFFPYALTKKIFNVIGKEYAKRFSKFHISKTELLTRQNEVIMLVRPSMRKDLESCGLTGGYFFYSLWQGYRDKPYQREFEEYLGGNGFTEARRIHLHTSGHASVADIQRVITGLNPKKIVPVHTMLPDTFADYFDKVECQNDGVMFEV